MIKYTNFQAYQIVKAHYEENRDSILKGILSEKEVETITEAFGLNFKDKVQLQDARDFVVCITDSSRERLNDDDWDLMSAIITVIDTKIGGNI